MVVRLKATLGNHCEGADSTSVTLTLSSDLVTAARFPVGGGGGANEALFGTWQQKTCLGYPGPQSFRRFYRFDENGGAETSTFFAGTDICAELPRPSRSGRFLILSSEMRPKTEFWRWISRGGELSMTPLTQFAVDSANTFENRGFTDRKVGVTKTSPVSSAAKDKAQRCNRRWASWV